MKSIFLPGLVLFAGSAIAESHHHGSHDTLTVTANRVEESWLESAETITILTDEDIAERNIKTVAQLVEQVPGITLYENYNGVLDVNYRGSNTSVFEGSSPIVVYVDGIPLSNRNGITFDINDVELVEAVRGPAGAIYGKNNIGGVINITTRRPQQETASAFSVKAGNVGAYHLNGFITSGLGDHARFKLNSTVTTFDGDLAYEDSTVSTQNVDREDTFHINAAIEADIGDNGLLSASLIHDDRQYGYGYVDAVNGLNELNQGPHPSSVSHSTRTDQDIQSLSYKISYLHQWDAHEFEVIASSRNQHYKGLFECDHSANPIPLGPNFVADSIDCKTDVEHEELNLEGRWQHTTEVNTWLMGAYFEQLDTTNKHNGQFARVNNQLSVILDSKGKLESRTLALFGQNIWQFAPEWQLVVGGRLQQVKKTADFNNPTMGGVVSYSGDKTDDMFLPKVALSWQFSPQQSTYLAYNKGYLPGGYNYINNSPNIKDAEFDAQTSDEIEWGYKLQLESALLTANLFHTDIQDIQSMDYEPTGAFFAVNIDGATSRGAEVEGHWDINDMLRLDGGVSWVDATYDSGAIHQGGSVSGNRVEYTPKTSANLGLSGWHDEWFARVGVRHLGDKYIDAKNTGKLDAYQVWNASIGYATYEWSAHLWIDNLTDEFGVSNAYPAVNNYARNVVRPRQFGLTVKAAF